MGWPVVTGAVAPGEDAEVCEPGFEPAKHMGGTFMPTQDDHLDCQAIPDPSMPAKDGQSDSQATPDPNDATPTLREAAWRLARFTEEVQLK